MSDLKLAPGGLMRCCTGTFSDRADSGDMPDEDGSIIACHHCSSSMILKDGVWRWNRD